MEVILQQTDAQANGVERSQIRLGRVMGRSMLALGLATAPLAVDTVFEAGQVAATGDTYPDYDAVDCNSQYSDGDPYNWCKGSPLVRGSSRGYDFRNCTDWVAWRAPQLIGVAVPQGWHDAGNWDNAASVAGYTVDTTPESGDIAVWDGTGYGHVAVVESVNADNTVNVSEYNKEQDGRYGVRSNVTANHYIDLNGTGVGLNGESTNTPPPPSGSGPIPYAATREGEEFYSDQGIVYTRAGGAAFPIEDRNDWTLDDTARWGNEPYGPVPTAEVHDHEAGYTNTRTVGAHPPANGTTVFLDTTGQQYYFYNGGAYPIGPGEVDDLGVRDKALRIPSGRLWDFTDRSITLPNGSLYRGAGQPNVKLLAQQPDGSKNSYKVGSVILRDCLTRVQGKSEIVLPQSALPYAESGVSVLTQSAACEFPPGWVIFSPDPNHPGQRLPEQWRIEGDNSSQPYTKRYFPSSLTTYLHTSGNPRYETASSAQDITTMPRGADMTIPEGIAFVDRGNGAEFVRKNGEWRHVPWSDMNSCLGIEPWQIVQVPSEAVVALPQGPQMSCAYENRIIYGSNGAQYYVTPQGKRQYIGTGAISSCIGTRRGAGTPFQVSDSDVNAYPLDNTQAYCNYEQELALNLVREDGDPTVWLVHPNGTKEHVGSFCVTDPNDTPLKRFHLFVVPAGETAGHVNTGVFWANGAICDQLPGAGVIWHA